MAVAHPKSFRLLTDGASRGNPGHAGIGVVIHDDTGACVYQEYRYIGVATNNQAEYRALIVGLQAARPFNLDRLDVSLDSQIVVEQMNGGFKVKDSELRVLYDQATKLRASLSEVVIRHVSRDRNEVADALANRAIDEHLSVVGAEVIED